MMQKRHFELIAGVLRNYRAGNCIDFAIDEIAERFADQLQKENPRFDRPRFLDACGWREGKPGR